MVSLQVHHKASLAPYMANSKKNDKTGAKRVNSKSAGGKVGRAQPSRGEVGVAHVVKHSSRKDDDKLSTKQPERPTVEQDTFTVADHGLVFV